MQQQDSDDDQQSHNGQQDYQNNQSNNNQKHFSQSIQEKEAIMQIKFEEMNPNIPQGYNEHMIDTEQAQTLVDQMSDLLDHNCSPAASYFYDTHPDYVKNFGDPERKPHLLNFDKFKQILEDALYEQEEFEKKNPQPQSDDEDNQFGNNNNQNQNNSTNNNNQQQQPPQQIGNNDNQGGDDMYIPQQSHFEEEPENNIYTKHNNMIFGNFIQGHNKELLDYFTDFSKEESGEPKILGQDVPLVMRVAFYIDNITFHQTKEDPDEFFNKEDSYKVIIAQLDKYLQNQEDVDSTTLDVTTFKLQFIQFLDFVEFFLQNEPDIFLRRVDGDEDQINLTGLNDTDIQESDLEKELKVNIAKYEKMLEEAKTENERIVINNMLKTLYDQLSKIESIKQPISMKKQKRILSKEENRKKNLNEIFIFYCKQQYTQAPKYSFDRLLYESHTMNLSNFLLFAKQFKVNNYCLKLTKKMLPQLFKKVSANYKELTFQEFQVISEKIAILMFEEKEDLPTEFDKIEAYYKYIGVDDPNFYRKHMNILNPPFNIQDPVGFRHLPKDKDRNIEIKRIPPKLQSELEKRKKEREILVQKFVSMTPQAPSQKHFYTKSQPNASVLNHSLSQAAPFSPLKQQQQERYAAKNHQKQMSKLNLQNKVSWQQLEKISYADMKQIQQNSRFKPSDLFDDQDDQEDKVYLKQYDLEEEKMKKQELSYIHRKEQESYGNYRNPLRPSQKYMLKHDPNYSERGYQQSNIHRSHDDSINNPYYYQQQGGGGGYQNQGNVGSTYKNSTINNNNKNNQYIGQNYMQRAQQVDDYQRQKENQQLQNIMYTNNNQQQRGGYNNNKR